MSKRIRNLMIGVVVLVLVTGSLITLLLLMPKNADGDDSLDSTESTAPEYTVTEISVEGIQSITVKNGEGTFTLTQPKENEWECAELSKLPFEADKYKSFAEGFAALNSSKQIESDELSDYGLDKPTATVEIKTAEKTVLLSMGSAAPGDSSGHYVMKNGDDHIYILSGYDCEGFEKTKKDFIKTSLVASTSTQVDPNTGQQVSTSTIDNLNLSGSNFKQPIKIVKLTEEEISKNDSYMSEFAVLEGTRKTSVDADKFPTMISGLTSLYASEITELSPSKEKLKEYGLDNPSAIAEYGFEEKNYKVSLGKKTEGSYYMLFNDYDVVYRIPESSVPWANASMMNIKAKLLFITNIDKISQITFKTNEFTHVFDLVDDGEELVVKTNGNVTATDNFRNLYQVIIGVSPQDEEDNPPQINPAATMIFKYKDTSVSDKVITFTPNGSRRYFYAIDGNGTVNVSQATLDKLLNGVNNYVSGKEVSTN